MYPFIQVGIYTRVINMNNNTEHKKMCGKFGEFIWEMHPDSEYNLVGEDEKGNEVHLDKGQLLSKDNIKSLFRVLNPNDTAVEGDFKTYKIKNELDDLCESEDLWLRFFMDSVHSKSWNGENWVNK